MLVIAGLSCLSDKFRDGNDEILHGLHRIMHFEAFDDILCFWLAVVVIQRDQLFNDATDEALDPRGHVGQCGTMRWN